MMTKEHIHKAIDVWAHRYADKDGNLFIGVKLSDLKTNLRSNGWKNVSRLDMSDVKNLGVEVVTAQYVGGARPTGKFCEIAVLKTVEKVQLPQPMF